jgi:hypothetical protein
MCAPYRCDTFPSLPRSHPEWLLQLLCGPGMRTPYRCNPFSSPSCLLQLLCGLGRQADGQDHPLRQRLRQVLCLHPARAPGSGGPDHPLELPAADAGVEVRALLRIWAGLWPLPGCWLVPAPAARPACLPARASCIARPSVASRPAQLSAGHILTCQRVFLPAGWPPPWRPATVSCSSRLSRHVWCLAPAVCTCCLEPAALNLLP